MVVDDYDQFEDEIEDKYRIEKFEEYTYQD
jgi:hypothetical protein